MAGREKEIVRHLRRADLLTETADEKVIFAASWIENHLGGFLQKLS